MLKRFKVDADGLEVSRLLYVYDILLVVVSSVENILTMKAILLRFSLPQVSK